MPKLSKRLARYKDVRLDEADIGHAVALYEHLREDFGPAFIKEKIEDKADEVLRGKWSLEARRDAAILAWMADRLRRESA